MGMFDSINSRNVLSDTESLRPQFAVKSGGSSGGISGMMSELMPYFHEIRNRDLSDAQARQSMMGSVRPDGLRKTFGSEGSNQPMNTVMGEVMTPYQSANIALEREKLNQSSRFGEERLNQQQNQQSLNQQRLELDQLKNRQIYETKISDMERKSEDAANNLRLAHQRLEQNQNDAAALMNYRNATIAAQDARHALELAQRDRDREDRERLNQARIDQINRDIEESGYTWEETTQSDNPDGSQTRRRIIQRGKAPDNKFRADTPGAGNSTRMMGPDGRIGWVPNDKVNEFVTKYNGKYVDDSGKVK